MRISDWSSDVCSSDLHLHRRTRNLVGLAVLGLPADRLPGVLPRHRAVAPGDLRCPARLRHAVRPPRAGGAEEVPLVDARPSRQLLRAIRILMDKLRSEEHTSELQSQMRI